MLVKLFNIVYLCDGVCCDMVMLILLDIFEYIWGILM